jgi:hypothetical protein
MRAFFEGIQSLFVDFLFMEYLLQNEKLDFKL